MAIYVEKFGTDLNNDVTQKGTEDNRMDYSASKILSNFWRRIGQTNMWVYDLGVILDQDDSFWGRVNFKTPTNFATTRTAGGGVYSPYAFLGYINQGNTANNGNNLCFYNYNNTIQRSQITDDAVNNDRDTWNAGLAASTEYYLIMSYDGVAQQLEITLYLASDDSVVHTFNTVTLTPGRTFTVDSFGLRTLIPGDGNAGYWTNDWEVTYLKANSETRECPTTVFPSAPPYNTEKYWSDLDTDRIIRNGITILSGSYSITTEQQGVYGYAIFLQDELPNALADPFNRVRCRLDVIPTEDEQEVIFGVIANYVFSTRTGIFYGIKINNVGVYAINGNFSIDGVGEGTVVADTETIMTYCDVSMIDDEWCFLDVSIGAVDVDINLYDSAETNIAYQTVPNKSSTNGYCGYCLYEKHEDKPEVKPYFDDCYIDDSSPYE